MSTLKSLFVQISQSWIDQRKDGILYCQNLRWYIANFTGQNFWARGYFVSKVGANEVAIRSYIRKQEQSDLGIGEMKMF